MATTQTAKQLIATALEHLERNLANGQSADFQEYLRFLSRFHRYSFHNCLLIASQMPGASRVAGFRAWKKLGRWVRKGERGIAIIVPIKIRKEIEEGEEEQVVRFGVGYVFDVSQTEGDSLPERPGFRGDPNAYLDRLYHLTADSGISVEKQDSLGPGVEGLSHGGKIQLLNGLTPAQEFQVLTHELAHELLHKVDAADRPSRTVRETEAEAVAFAVSEGIGLDCNTASSDYISLYEGDCETLQASLGRIQATASRILGAVLQRDVTPG